ncbi:nuclear transport factor 2 family protein [Streptomyces sp. NPDC090493]|uniref:nuclear transport factor 2 family protein n=1 Tax=Streptomyces sp. NPDC090493 TaxID=3365964 RepID=UPI00381322D0
MAEPTYAQRLERLRAVQEVKNLMARYAYYHVANQHGATLELCALDTPGVRHELPFGIYEGKAGLERLYLGLLAPADREPEGKLHLHTMTTPVIEVAGDLQTAKGIWISPGVATDRRGGEKFQAAWRCVKYGADFVQEEGRWKIWHLRMYGIFATPFDKSWVDSAVKPGETRPAPPQLPEEFQPDRPGHEFWQYRTDAIIPNEPVPPRPYETFDEAQAY